MYIQSIVAGSICDCLEIDHLRSVPHFLKGNRPGSSFAKYVLFLCAVPCLFVAIASVCEANLKLAFRLGGRKDPPSKLEAAALAVRGVCNGCVLFRCIGFLCLTSTFYRGRFHWAAFSPFHID